MKRILTVIDTNILYAGLRSRSGSSFQILNLFYEKQITPVLTVPLLLEYEQTLINNATDLKLTKTDIEIFLNTFCKYGERYKVYYLWRPWLKDPKDEMVLEAAVVSKCKSIVTFNRNDFKGSEQLGVSVYKPKEFLEKWRKTK